MPERFNDSCPGTGPRTSRPPGAKGSELVSIRSADDPRSPAPPGLVRSRSAPRLASLPPRRRPGRRGVRHGRQEQPRNQRRGRGDARRAGRERDDPRVLPRAKAREGDRRQHLQGARGPGPPGHAGRLRRHRPGEGRLPLRRRRLRRPGLLRGVRAHRGRARLRGHRGPVRGGGRRSRRPAPRPRPTRRPPRARSPRASRPPRRPLAEVAPPPRRARRRGAGRRR